ncbi:MAG TPA: hypothetical protein VNK23_06155 [Candidatus Dormibacteraeota bacterium]|nr:hypothetical protein [Candidatus Dormibacteraeota bacterium]
MDNNKSQTSWLLTESRPRRRGNDIRRRLLVGERQIVELISLGAPLPGILNKLCTAIDLQIGNSVSLVLLPDDQDNDLLSITRLATECGLNVFSSRSILSSDRSLLGRLQIYCCDQRRPTPHEAQLITRVIHLAAVALQRQEDAAQFPKNYGHLKRKFVDSPPEKTPYVN